MVPVKPVTNLTELAALAGVSPGTASRALSGNGMLSAKTRERIRRLADEHGFRLNQTARNLKLGRTNAIAVVLPLGHESAQNISDPFFIALIGHLADELTARKQDLVLSKVIPVGEDWLSSIVRGGRVDGVIVIGQSNQDAILNSVASHYRSLIVWGERQDVGQVYASVGTDNRRGGWLATDHLLKRGRRRIAFVGTTDIPEIAARHAGYLAALAEAGIAPGPHIEAHLTADASHEAISDFLAGAAPGLAPLDAIFAASDVIAMSAIRALNEHGFVVPDDVSVVGFDDVNLAAHTSPPLTTIRQDLAEAARLLVDRLFARIDGAEPSSVVLPPELVVRRST
ncbi:LacI family transcriptional regulator [Sphingomonas oleivorans]|uniref:LacI family transcriptional regulator n=1 Tax=Sphingomonas oleivorans TaxID=1735121 RepID=A0A2T5G2Y3_9SPHN|nr:substrate-binding domain-containing protein [Sphingomonas oleivorans]PTQ13509.1 LacI family transcriptional regulator [Sphingomonas oleivorans]